MTDPFVCGCGACKTFLEDYREQDGTLTEYWAGVARWTADHLMTRGWSGGITDNERPFMRAHGPAWYQETRRRPLDALNARRRIKSDAVEAVS